MEPKVLPLPSAALDRIHRELTPWDVDLGYAGRRAAQHPVHAAIARLSVETHSISSSAIFGMGQAACGRAPGEGLPCRIGHSPG